MVQKYTPFAVEEYKSRTAKARDFMSRNRLDACVFTKGSNIIYFSGYTTTLFNSEFRPFFYVLPVSGDPVLIAPYIEHGGAVKTTWIDDVRIWGANKPGVLMDPVELLSDVLHEKKLDAARIGFELSNGQRLAMTMAQFDQLKGLLPRMTVADSEAVVWSCRMVKSPAEVGLIRKACEANDAGFEAAVATIRAGATEEEVKIAMAGEMVRMGAMPQFTTVAAGPNRYDMMNPDASSKVVMEKGMMVVMDFGCTYDRYYTDVTRGVFVGEPHPRARELYCAVRDISEHALKAAKPGNPVKAIDAASEKRIRDLGYFDLMMHRTGHSLGLEVHETPSIGPADETILEPGMVFAIEPGLYDFSVGAFRIEDVILITETGWEFLTKGSREVIVK